LLHPNLVTVATIGGPAIVGLTFIWAGVIKAISPHVFQQHLSQLRLVPHKLRFTSVVIAAGLEVGWGMALLLGVAPPITLPVTAVLLVGFTAVSWWGVHSGRTTDCGCYGGYVVPSTAQSIALNAVFIVLVLIALALGNGTIATPLWKLIAVTLATIVSGGVTVASFRFLNENGRFMIDVSPLKVGGTWRSRWGVSLPYEGEHLVSYLGPDCPHCKQWVRVLNAIDQSSGLPDVTGIVATTGERLDSFVTASGIRFPMRMIPQTLMRRLVWGVPKTVLVSRGRIQNEWSGHMPPEFFQRFRDAFFPGTGATAPDAEALASRNT
jgi:uncharacterized membrane protein YphA (DoxX/SURF4 family)